MSYTRQFRRRLKPLVKKKDRKAIKRLFVEYATKAAVEDGQGAIEALRQVLRDEWYGKPPNVRRNVFKIDLD